jgi:hypothetical protein
MQMFVEEALDFLFVYSAHLLWGDGDQVAVLVVSFGGQLVNVCFGRDSIVEDAELGEVVCGHFAAGVMRKALVALGLSVLLSQERIQSSYLFVVEPVCFHLCLFDAKLKKIDGREKKRRW